MATVSKHPRKFPREIARFLHLEGGQYGTLDLLAMTAHTLELQTGADFVLFTREQATDLRDAVQKFLDLCELDAPQGQETVEVVEELAPRAQPRPRRRSRSATG